MAPNRHIAHGGNRCVIYTRVSSDQQEAEGTSLATQSERCREHATGNGYAVVGEYQDIFTGAKLRERPAMTELLRHVRTGVVNVVLAYSLDRLSRTHVHIAVIDDECQQHGARLEFVTEAFEDNTMGIFVRSVAGFVGELERERLIERTVRGRYERARRGKRIPTKKPCYGYIWSDREKSGFVVEPYEAATVVRIYTEIAHGKSLHAVAEGLQRDNIPSPSGQTHWNPNTLRNIVRTPEYVGQGYAWGRADIIQRGDYSKAVTLPGGDALRLVPDEIKAACLAVLSRNKQESSRNSRDPERALLRVPFAVCGVCGGTMVVNKRIYKYKEKRTHYYEYICLNHHRKKGCPSYTAMRVDELDAAVWAGVKRVLTEPDLIRSYIETQRTEDPTAARLSVVERQASEAERKLRNLADSLAGEDNKLIREVITASMADYAKRVEQFRNDHETLLAQKREWQANKAAYDSIEATYQHADADFDNLSYTQKRDVLRALQVSVRIWSKKFPMRYDLDLTVSYSFWRPDADSPGEASLTDELKAPLIQALTGQPVTAPVKQFSYLKGRAEQGFCSTVGSSTRWISSWRRRRETNKQ